MIAYLTGLLLVAVVPSLSVLHALWPLLALLPFARTRRWLLPLLLGVGVGVVHGLWQLHHRLPLSLDGVQVSLRGYVQDLPVEYERSQRVTLRVDQVLSDEPALQRLRRLELTLADVDRPLHAGDYLWVDVRLRSPRSLRNPLALDRERRYLYQRIDARGHIRHVEQHTSVKSPAALRQTLRDNLRAGLQGSDASWLLPAIVVGDRSALGEEEWQVLRRTGTAHLLVVSGLHIGVLAGSGLLLGRLLLGGLILLRLNSPVGRALPLLLAFVCASFYAWLSGFNLPVQRAWLMVTIFLLGEWRMLRWSGWQRWRYALLMIATLQPLALLEAGAWMSFMAVALLLWLSQTWRLSRGGRWHLLWQTQWVIFIGMLPLMAFLFQQLGMLAPLVNAWAVPLFSLYVMTLPLTLPWLLLNLDWAWQGHAWWLDTFWQWLVVCAQSGWGYYTLARPTLTTTLWISLSLGVLLLPLPLRWRWPGLLGCLPLLLPPSPLPAQGEFRAIVFDVGQGLAVLVETAEGRLLYDTGPGYFSGGSAWPSSIAPWFRGHNVDYLEHLVISHRDLDHSGGLAALEHQLRTGVRESGSPVLQARGFDSCEGPRQWQYGGVMFRYLTLPAAEGTSENDRSCVLEVRNSACSLLLTGDITHAVEYDLVRSGQLQPVTWLVAGHHGSATSSAQVFIETLQPDAVFYTAGFNNRYGHPAADVVKRFEQAGSRGYSTAEAGALWLQSEGEHCRVIPYRDLKRRYWTNG